MVDDMVNWQKITENSRQMVGKWLMKLSRDGRKMKENGRKNEKNGRRQGNMVGKMTEKWQADDRKIVDKIV